MDKYSQSGTGLKKILRSNLKIIKMYDLLNVMLIQITSPNFVFIAKYFEKILTLVFTNQRKINARKNMTLEQQRENAHKTHLANKALARTMKANYKDAAINDDTIQCFAIDLQEVLQTPFGETGELYYYSKFAVYNFTCFNVASKPGYCYVWDETIAKRGASEVSSCLFKLVEEHCAKEDTELVLFADNCPGQNK